MMKRLLIILFICALSACSWNEQRLDSVPANAPENGGQPLVRKPFDRVGYTHSAEGIAKVVSHAEKAEKDRLEEIRSRLNLDDETTFTAAISPHDDYLYAQQVYVHLYPYLKARHVILVGVAHRARNFPECDGKIVFDAFDAWHGPYGDVPVSPLREDLIRSFPDGDVQINNEIHAGEHSVEGMIPFLQHFNRDVAIVPVLIPYMSSERLLELADRTAAALHGIMKKNRLTLGADVAILISADCVHYGDRDWGGKVFADFGTDGAGYDKGVARDLSLVSDHLTGKISVAGLQEFYQRVVAEDFHEYKITWCGRFSIPFGLACLIQLTSRLGEAPPQGDLLCYGTTLDPGRSDPEVSGLGVTAEANLHHWVGFTAIGYR